MKEECGVEIDVGDVACVSEEIFLENGEIKFHYVIIDFYARIVGGELRVGSDALEARWVHFDEIKNLNVVDFVRRLVERIRSGKGGIYLR